MRHIKFLTTTVILLLTALTPARAEEFITVASTTSTQNSGLFDRILPIFQKESGIEVRVVAQGTGQALETGRRGDADVLLVHARAAEDLFIEEGYGINRRDVMFNDFVIIGPKGDPAGTNHATSAADAMARIASSQTAFASRGDESGTHMAERRLWDAANITPKGDWYLETGSGMGATLNVATQKEAYALTDRGTWISFQNRSDLEIQFEGDPSLFNPYGVILVNPKLHPYVKAEEGNRFIDWLTSELGQAAIADFRIDGQQLFFPNANK